MADSYRASPLVVKPHTGRRGVRPETDPKPYPPPPTIPPRSEDESSSRRIRSRDWRCPNCQLRLGEIIGKRVIIQIGSRQVRMPVANTPETDCPRCGETSRLGDAA